MGTNFGPTRYGVGGMGGGREGCGVGVGREVDKLSIQTLWSSCGHLV